MVDYTGGGGTDGAATGADKLLFSEWCVWFSGELTGFALPAKSD